MPEKLEVLNPYKRPLDARKVMDKLTGLSIKPLTVVVDNSNWIIAVELLEKPDKNVIQEVEKALRDKELYAPIIHAPSEIRVEEEGVGQADGRSVQEVKGRG